MIFLYIENVRDLTDWNRLGNFIVFYKSISRKNKLVIRFGYLIMFSRRLKLVVDTDLKFDLNMIEWEQKTNGEGSRKNFDKKRFL